MKKIAAFFVLLFALSNAFAQVKIHSHNDYLQPQILKLAYENRVYEIEADVFEVNGALIVAHTKNELNAAKTLRKLYLNPIDSLFKLHKGKVSADSRYTFTLMIDFKTAWEPTYQALKKEIESYGDTFDRSKNKNAVQIVISGNRPADTTFHRFPNWVYFDGLSNINYLQPDLKRITMISENFRAYSKWNGLGQMPEADQAKFKEVVKVANQLRKPVRFWGAPDTPETWRTLQQLGAKIINTDKIVACKTFLNEIK